MRGFVITTDAMFAISLFLIAMVVVSMHSFQPQMARGLYLKQVTLDVLTVSEKAGRLADAADGNSSAVRELMEATPELACMELEITDYAGTPVITTAKSDCGSYGKELQTAYRSFRSEDGSMYVVKVYSWYRRTYT